MRECLRDASRELMIFLTAEYDHDKDKVYDIRGISGDSRDKYRKMLTAD